LLGGTGERENAHRQIAHPVRVELVARAASGAFRDEFGAHAARLWIEYHGIEIGHPIKQGDEARAAGDAGAVINRAFPRFWG